MKTTDYFQNKVLKKRPYIKVEWIEYVLAHPLKVEYQSQDNRVRFWGYVEELGKYLRVFTLSDG